MALKKSGDETPAIDDVPTKFTNLEASIVPQAGELKDFDFDLNLSDPTDIGAESTKLQYTGSGQFDGADFTFSGPIA